MVHHRVVAHAVGHLEQDAVYARGQVAKGKGTLAGKGVEPGLHHRPAARVGLLGRKGQMGKLPAEIGLAAHPAGVAVLGHQARVKDTQRVGLAQLL